MLKLGSFHGHKAGDLSVVEVTGQLILRDISCSDLGLVLRVNWADGCIDDYKRLELV